MSILCSLKVIFCSFTSSLGTGNTCFGSRKCSSRSIKITFSGLKVEKVKCVSFDGGEIAAKAENSVTLKNLKTTSTLIISEG